MKKGNVKRYLIPAFCLIAFTGFAQAQTNGAELRKAAKAESNEIELARQKKHLQFQKELKIKRWRQLKVGMTEKQVQKILGRPKLIQAGSHECVWFYQDIPLSNALVKYIYEKDSMGRTVREIGISNVGEAKHGIVLFEAKSLGSLIDEEETKRDRAIAEIKEEREKRDRAIRDGDRAFRAIGEAEQARGPWGRRSATYDRKAIEAIAKAEQARAEAEQAAKRNRGRGRRQIRSRDERRPQRATRSRHETRDEIPARQRRENSYKTVSPTKVENYYSMQVKRLKESPRSPVFELRFFNQPDWNRFEALLAKKKPQTIKSEKPMDKWKNPPRWKKLLKINMTVQQVRALLGEPERSQSGVGGKTSYYGNIPGHGELYFSARSDLGDYLDLWIEPFWPAVEKSLIDIKVKHQTTAKQVTPVTYEIVESENQSHKAMTKSLSSYTYQELVKLPIDKKMGYRVVVSPTIKAHQVRPMVERIIADLTSQDDDIDEISLLLYSDKELANGMYDVARATWAPHGELGNVTPEIAKTNDRTNYKLEIQIAENLEQYLQKRARSENKFDLSEAERRQIFKEIVAAEDRAQANADRKYPISGRTVWDLSKSELRSRMDKNIELMQRLQDQYKKALAKKYGLTQEQLKETSLEGVVERWPMPKFEIK